MDNQEFVEKALRTESSSFKPLVAVDGTKYSSERLLHAALGMQTETAEFSDALKKAIFYGKPLDVVNLCEELGDLFWYMAIAVDELKTTFTKEQTRVIKKLELRYPDKFSEDKAENRNLEAERALLESHNR